MFRKLAIEESKQAEKQTSSPLRPLSERRLHCDKSTQKWMLALLLYNTCLAPMSTYCADSIFQYGMDVAKYNVISIIFKYLMREVI